MNIFIFNINNTKETWQSSSRSSHQRCSIKKVFLTISLYSQENICIKHLVLIKLHAFTPFSQSTSGQMLLFLCNYYQLWTYLINNPACLLNISCMFNLPLASRCKVFPIFSGGLDSQGRTTLTLTEHFNSRPSWFPSLIMTNRGFSVCYIWPIMVTSKKPLINKCIVKCLNTSHKWKCCSILIFTF